ncbi:sigma-70 family RNA polymerase sigma factor [Aequorivita sp. SDUM287046]|uniref:Sigma-70 family RNA polymerase sigma factor n=1 Tax=Aequorivita aurantiaca TaxID=3053356 RepID=A0ABT8DP42_9FLAO|nr:sigma-70 family RNA polymerase sigma factor [Aequorivita aurantiaca]MDN3724970.1 sigma-70 family RNA polymerase sigma factor [Aequorivita aurantiaca]
METQKIWNRFNEEVYFFILKKVKNETATHDIFQNTFLKIHKSLHQLKDEEKVKAWVFQITRNEIANHFNKESKYIAPLEEIEENISEKKNDYCCFDKFINDLPPKYRETIELVYIQGKKQEEAAKILAISLANVKARIRRSKDILKEKFAQCCKYEFDKNGSLIGEPNCPEC